MTKYLDSPRTGFESGVTGPLLTLALAIVFTTAGVVADGWDQAWNAMHFQNPGHTTAFLAVTTWLASINVLILFFNLIPAFPLDGGRITRAIAWKVTGDRNRATRGAARLGQGFSYLFIALGIVAFFSGNLIDGIWLALIGFILLQSARGAVIQTEFTSRIEGLRVADVMDDEPVAIPENASVERALDEFFLRYRWPWFPVVDPAQRF